MMPYLSGAVMNKITNLVARILISLPLLVFGLGHLGKAQQMAGMVPAYVPGGILWIYITGAALILAAVAFVTGKEARLAGFLAALLLLTFVLTIQLPGMTKAVEPSDAVGAAYKMAAFTGFFKDLGLAGAALLISATAKKN
jgi:putative oxidoreductase